MAELPPVAIQENFRLVGHHDLSGFPNAGEGVAMKVTNDGRRFLFIANENPPVGFSVLDVSDPTRPELVWQLQLPHDEVRGNSIALKGDLLLAAFQV